MPSVYQVGGRTADTAATAENVGGGLWNPHASKPLWVREIWWFQVASTAACVFEISRMTARGTATVTVTPDIDNDRDRLLAPGTGAVLDVTYSGQPTLVTPTMVRGSLPAAIGAGFMLVLDPPIRVAAGEGLCVGTPVATILRSGDVTFVWQE